MPTTQRRSAGQRKRPRALSIDSDEDAIRVAQPLGSRALSIDNDTIRVAQPPKSSVLSMDLEENTIRVAQPKKARAFSFDSEESTIRVAQPKSPTGYISSPKRAPLKEMLNADAPKRRHTSRKLESESRDHTV
jgi:hypothetical protein